MFRIQEILSDGTQKSGEWVQDLVMLIAGRFTDHGIGLTIEKHIGLHETSQNRLLCIRHILSCLKNWCDGNELCNIIDLAIKKINEILNN